jgi:hypothetical protein
MQNAYVRPTLLEVGRVVEVTFAPNGACVDFVGGYPPA